MRATVSILTAALLLAGAVSPLAAADADGFRAAKTKLQQRVRSKRTEDRLDAVRELGEYQQPEAARLLAQVQLKDGTSEVRIAAYEALLSYNKSQEMCDAMLATAKKDASGKEPGEAVLLLAVLVASPLSKVEADALALIDGPLGMNKAGPGLVAALADELSHSGRLEELTVLRRLAKTKIFAEVFGVRRAIVQGIANIQRKEAVEAVIELLPGLQGEVLADAVSYLGVITAQAHGDNFTNWKMWWEANQATFSYPVSVVRTPVRTVTIKAGSMSEYYGLPIYAQRMVFIMDTSGSMAGDRLAAAKRELVYAITKLNENSQFSIVVFNGRVLVWQRNLVPANAVSKKAAKAFVEGQVAISTTASYDALEAAMNFDAEAIYFLTDGQPSSGKVIDPAEIVNVITRRNKSKRESIYTIGIGVGPPGNPFDVFLSALAEQNQGVYRRVDE